jgi:hypothetical protein
MSFKRDKKEEEDGIISHLILSKSISTLSSRENLIIAKFPDFKCTTVH